MTLQPTTTMAGSSQPRQLVMHVLCLSDFDSRVQKCTLMHDIFKIRHRDDITSTPEYISAPGEVDIVRNLCIAEKKGVWIEIVSYAYGLGDSAGRAILRYDTLLQQGVPRATLNLLFGAATETLTLGADGNLGTVFVISTIKPSQPFMRRERGTDAEIPSNFP